MAGSSNFVQWNPSAANQVSDGSYVAPAAAGAAFDAAFPSNVANKLFYQVTTFVAAFAQALAAQGLTVSDASLSTLAGVLASIVVNGATGTPVTLGTLTANNVTVASLLSTTGISCNGGIQSGAVSSTPGLYAIVDGSLVLHTGFTGPVAGRSSVGGIII